MTHTEQLITAAKAEDTYDLLQHIAWTDVIRPLLEANISLYSRMLVNEALGTKLPEGLTREQVAGRCYGINHIITLLEKILRDGERAIRELRSEGISLTS